MSRAFVKEDAEVVERVTRRRSASGLPPGALNFLTARGARELRDRISSLRRRGDVAAVLEMERILASATVVEPLDEPADSVTFGCDVTLLTADGDLRKIRVVGVDEVNLEENAVSWVSPSGRALLGAKRGQVVVLNDVPLTVSRFEIPR